MFWRNNCCILTFNFTWKVQLNQFRDHEHNTQVIIIKNNHLKRLVNTWFSCGGGILKDIPLPWKKKQVFLIISSNYLQPVSLAFSRCGWFSMFPQLGLAVTSTKPLCVIATDTNETKENEPKKPPNFCPSLILTHFPRPLTSSSLSEGQPWPAPAVRPHIVQTQTHAESLQSFHRNQMKYLTFG